MRRTADQCGVSASHIWFDRSLGPAWSYQWHEIVCGHEEERKVVFMWAKAGAD